ncbi:MAG TPA: hypothetical protein VED63_08450 [Acidimicrobiales bacterium]|nr:hypothetical protein [Acidimicrobiales bacterium]
MSSNGGDLEEVLTHLTALLRRLTELDDEIDEGDEDARRSLAEARRHVMEIVYIFEPNPLIGHPFAAARHGRQYFKPVASRLEPDVRTRGPAVRAPLSPQRERR